MNLKKIALSLTASSLLFGSTFSALGQASDDESYAYLIPILDLVLNSTSTCTTSEVELLTILSASGDGGFREGNPPENAIDDNPLTRWAHNNGEDFSNTEAIITFKLGATATVTDLSVSWLSSDDRNSFFSIDTSTDNITWTSIFPNGITEITAIDGQFQTHDVIDTSANYVRIIGDGNAQNNFTSINEVQINGCVGLLPDSSSSSSSSSSSTGSSSSSSGGTRTIQVQEGITLTTFDESSSTPTNVEPDFGLSADVQPWDNFDLSVWGLDSPALRNISNEPERGTRIDDFEFVALRDGAQEGNSAYDAFFIGENGSSNSEASSPYFFTGSDGGMVFKSPVDGGRTSSGARFPRSELREYVRGGIQEREDGSNISVTGANENNWVLGYQPEGLVLDNNNVENVGGRNGVLTGTLRVNKVTETGRPDDIGVTIIGQIHAESDEPLRLYYRKLPQNELGSVYVLHEIRGDMDDEQATGRSGDDLNEINLVGSRDDDASNPENGIALDELFSYEIINDGSTIEVVLRRGDFDGVEIARTTIDMAIVVDEGVTGSGYDRADEWMYFKAGAYTQNNVAVEDGVAGAATTGFGVNGDEADYDQVTFYRVAVSHDENVLPDASSEEEAPDPTEETPDPTEETPEEPTDTEGTTVTFGTGVTITTFDTTSTGIPADVSAFGLNPGLQPWQNFDLSVWGLDSPSIRDLNEEVTGAAPRGVRIDDFEFIALQEGPSNEDYESALALYEGTNDAAQSSEPYFFTGDDGGMVFKSPVNGARTSSNTSFPRSELREYVRGGITRRENASGTGTESISTSGANENNWVLGYQPNNLVFDDNGRDGNIQNVGGRNGRLAASLKVNRVTVTGANDDVGVTIIGQIHAENDEPIRLYYRKLPQHDLGSVYVVHEIRRARDEDEPNDGRFGRDFPDIDLVGESSDSARAEEVANGIALDELFSYEIINEGELLIVNLYRGDLNSPIIASTTINMSTIVNQRDDAEGDPAGSGYDRIDEWMYFKAGAYTQNNTGDTTGFGEDLDGDGVGDEADFDLITFYDLSVSHDSNEPQ